MGCDDDEDAIRASGETVTRRYDGLGDFDAIAASAAFAVVIEQGAAATASVTVDDNVLDRVEVEVRGTTLRIGLEPGISIRGTATLQARVTMPSLRRIELSGASSAELLGFDAFPELAVDASGASRVAGVVDAASLTVELSGASRASLSGTADHATLDGSGASSFALEDLDVATASVELSGASHADVLVREALGRADERGVDPHVRGPAGAGQRRRDRSLAAAEPLIVEAPSEARRRE